MAVEITSTTLLSSLAGVAYFGLIIAFVLQVIMKRRPVGVTLSWLLLLIALPVGGMVLFLMFGHQRLGSKRLQRADTLNPGYSDWHSHLRQILPEQALPCGNHNRVYNLAEHNTSIPALCGNDLILCHDTPTIFKELLKDIENATESIHLEFYICEAEGQVTRILAALEAAAKRGVACRMLLDAVGSSQFLRSPEALRLKAAGVHVRASLQVGAVRMLFERIDLRNHRKLVVIDDTIAWTGSANLVDPTLFKQDVGVGQWVDGMIRIQGPAAHVSGVVFLYDWVLETGENVEVFRQTYQYPQSIAADSAAIHVVPSGPGLDRKAIHQVLLAAAYESQQELIVTTPYFIPDEALVTALCAAAMRGVQVIIIVPERNDSRMVHFASRSYYDELLDAGVQIMHFTAGLLHTKCVLVDRETVLFGTVNLDMRSVWLNFELTLIIYNQGFGQRTATLMEDYISRSQPLNHALWRQRPFLQRLAENTAQLLSPLL